MNASQIMQRNVITCRPHETLAEAAGRMWDHDIGCLPVIDDAGHVVGVITDRDACMAAYTRDRPLSAVPVEIAMSRDVRACLPSDTVLAVEEIMRARQVRRVPVVSDEGLLVGVVSLNDVARESARERGRQGGKGREVGGEEVAATLAAVCQPRSGALVPAAV